MYYISALTILTVLLTFVYASYLDVKSRTVPFKTWYPIFIICTPLVIIDQIIAPDITVITLALFVSTMFYIVGIKELFKGADVWAYIWTFLYVFIPMGYGIIEMTSFIFQSALIGGVMIVLLYVKNRKWENIPFIPAITASLVYLVFFGAPL